MTEPLGRPVAGSRSMIAAMVRLCRFVARAAWARSCSPSCRCSWSSCSPATHRRASQVSGSPTRVPTSRRPTLRITAARPIRTARALGRPDGRRRRQLSTHHRRVRKLRRIQPALRRTVAGTADHEDLPAGAEPGPGSGRPGLLTWASRQGARRCRRSRWMCSTVRRRRPTARRSPTSWRRRLLHGWVERGCSYGRRAARRRLAHPRHQRPCDGGGGEGR